MKPKHMLRIFSLIALVALLLALAPVVHAISVEVDVDTTTDSNAAAYQVCTEAANDCSLRGAISKANADSGNDYTIALPAGTYTLALVGAGEDTNVSGDLDITSDIIIDGAGYGSSFINAAQIDRVLHVHSGATVELNHVALTTGRSLSGADTLCNGGGVRNQGSLTIQGSILSGNSSGTNITGNGCNGGGVYNEGALTLENSTISGNFAADASLSSNGHGGHGGGVFIVGGTVTIENSTISANTTGDGDGIGTDGHGGGMYMDGGAVTIENSTISGNVAKGSGGGVYNNSISAKPTLVHCTVTDNTADSDSDDNGDGGGMSWMAGGANVKNTIVADNRDETGDSHDDCYGASPYTSEGYNLVGTATGCPTSGTDLSTTDPKTNDLDDNNEQDSEGITHTHALQHNSPAVERIPVGANGCGDTYTTDQRGEDRPQGGLCDVGAHESSYILWDRVGEDSNTSTAANWSGDTTPAATDIPVFNDTSTNDATVDSNLTVGGWTIDSAYTGEIDAGSYTLDVNGLWRQEGGIFSGGSGTLDLGGAFNLSGGTFTAPSPAGGMTLSGDFTQSGGTFTHNSSIVTFDGSGAQTLATDTVNFYDLTVNPGSTLVKVGASNFDVDNTLTNNGTLQRTQNVNDSGNVIFFYTGGYGGLVLDAKGVDLGPTTVQIKGNQDCTDMAGETVQRCFDITPTNTSGRDATITFYFHSSELSGNACSTLDAYHWNESSWDAALTLDTSYDGDGRMCGSDPQSVRVKNVSDFSPFMLKSGAPCTDAVTPTSTSISLSGINVDLTWADDPANAGGYEVHRSTSPYFTPDSGSVHGEILPAGSTSTTDEGAAGSAIENYTYILRGLSNCGVPSGFEKRLGEFDFGLVPGSE